MNEELANTIKQIADSDSDADLLIKMMNCQEKMSTAKVMSEIRELLNQAVSVENPNLE